MKGWLRRRRLIRLLHGQITQDLGMNWWAKACNDSNRLARVKAMNRPVKPLKMA